MSTVQDRKAPSAGTKVNPGQHAPVMREGAGPVLSESLAAESYREGGEFASNRNVRPEVHHSGSDLSRSRSDPGLLHGASKADAERSKNLKEGMDDMWTQDGLMKALQSEPGSEGDPSRLAERQFQQALNARAGAGARQSGLTTETGYEVLDRETSS